MMPDPSTYVIVEQVAHGQWHCLCPDGVPRSVTNYAEAISAALFWASHGGYGVVCTNLERTTVLVAFPDKSQRRALVIRQESRTEWVVVVRTFSVRLGKRPTFIPPTEHLRAYAGALAEAHRIFRRSGLPVLIEPKGEEARFLSPGEQRAFRNSYTPSYPTYPTLGDILDRGPHHEC